MKLIAKKLIMEDIRGIPDGNIRFTYPRILDGNTLLTMTGPFYAIRNSFNDSLYDIQISAI